jgi:hypothetical protein
MTRRTKSKKRKYYSTKSTLFVEHMLWEERDRFFDTIFTVDHAIDLARVKLGQFRDSILPSQADETDGEYDLK